MFLHNRKQRVGRAVLCSALISSPGQCFQNSSCATSHIAPQPSAIRENSELSRTSQSQPLSWNGLFALTVESWGGIPTTWTSSTNTSQEKEMCDHFIAYPIAEPGAAVITDRTHLFTKAGAGDKPSSSNRNIKQQKKYLSSQKTLLIKTCKHCVHAIWYDYWCVWRKMRLLTVWLWDLVMNDWNMLQQHCAWRKLNTDNCLVVRLGYEQLKHVPMTLLSVCWI